MNHYTVTAVGVGGTTFTYKTQARDAMMAACEAYGKHGASLREGAQKEPLGPIYAIEIDFASSVLESPEGGTLALNGKELPTCGYFVGGIVSALIYQGDDEDGIQEFASYLYESTGAAFIGWRTDSETGQPWIDGTDWYEGLTAALVVARERGEIAIYDITNQAEIRL